MASHAAACSGLPAGSPRSRQKTSRVNAGGCAIQNVPCIPAVSRQLSQPLGGGSPVQQRLPNEGSYPSSALRQIPSRHHDGRATHDARPEGAAQEPDASPPESCCLHSCPRSPCPSTSRDESVSGIFASRCPSTSARTLLRDKGSRCMKQRKRPLQLCLWRIELVQDDDHLLWCHYRNQTFGLFHRSPVTPRCQRFAKKFLLGAKTEPDDMGENTAPIRLQSFEEHRRRARGGLSHARPIRAAALF